MDHGLSDLHYIEGAVLRYPDSDVMDETVKGHATLGVAHALA